MSIEPEIFWKTKQNETLKKNSLTLNTPEGGKCSLLLISMPRTAGTRLKQR